MHIVKPLGYAESNDSFLVTSASPAHELALTNRLSAKFSSCISVCTLISCCPIRNTESLHSFPTQVSRMARRSLIQRRIPHRELRFLFVEPLMAHLLYVIDATSWFTSSLRNSNTSRAWMYTDEMSKCGTPKSDVRIDIRFSGTHLLMVLPYRIPSLLPIFLLGWRSATSCIRLATQNTVLNAWNTHPNIKTGIHLSIISPDWAGDLSDVFNGLLVCHLFQLTDAVSYVPRYSVKRSLLISYSEQCRIYLKPSVCLSSRFCQV